MTWKKSEVLIKRRMNQQGLGPLIEAGQLCRQAEMLFPHLFRAISVRSGSLHLELTRENILPFRLIEGRLIDELNTFAQERKLPKITRVRLTFPTE